tara:strand:+ start:1865 stop:2305 length:441 start_codon:yes stop_codon:yes gene_type:complete
LSCIQLGAFFDDVGAEILASDRTRKSFRDIFLAAFQRYRADAFLGKVFDRGEYEKLMRGHKDPRTRNHIDTEISEVTKLLKTLQADGSVRNIDPGIITALLQAIVLLFLNEDEFDVAVFPAMMELLVGLIADHVAVAGESSAFAIG